MDEHMQSMRFRIDGMSCAACSARSQRALGAMPGMASVSVNLAGGTALLVPDRAYLSEHGISTEEFIRQVEDKIRSLGFTPAYLPPETDEHDAWEEEQARSDAALALRRKRLITEFAFAVPLVIIAMGSHWGLPLPVRLDPHSSPLAFALVQLVLTLPIVWSGRDFYRTGIPLLLRGAPNMDSLVAMGGSVVQPVEHGGNRVGRDAGGCACRSDGAVL